MPVEDHPVHATVRHGADARYEKCQGKQRNAGYWAKDRHYLPDGRFELLDRFIPDRLSDGCRYDMSLTDTWCDGCPQRGSGEAYAAKIRANGS